MKFLLPNTLRRLDRYCLLNHPILWIIRLHWVFYLYTLGLGLICLIALALPVSLQTAGALNYYFSYALVITALALSPWIYLQARFAPQIRQNSQPRTAAYLLLGYFSILAFCLAWPYTFVGILEGKVSNKISEGEFRKDLDIYMHLGESETLQQFEDRRARLDNKYCPSNEDMRTHRPPEYINNETSGAIRTLCFAKKICPGNFKPDPLSVVTKDPRLYTDWGFLGFLGFVALVLTTLLRAFQATNGGSMLATLLLGVAVGVALALLPLGSKIRDTIICGALLLLFSVGTFTILYIPKLRRKSILPATGINIFFLLLPWVPFLIWVLIDHYGDYPTRTFDWVAAITLFLIGPFLLLALTPWIQSRYLNLQAKPS